MDYTLRDFLLDYDFDYKIVLDNSETEQNEIVLQLVDLQEVNLGGIELCKFAITEEIDRDIIDRLDIYIQDSSLDPVIELLIEEHGIDADLVCNMDCESLMKKMVELGYDSSVNNLCYISGNKSLDLSELYKEVEGFKISLKEIEDYELDR